MKKTAIIILSIIAFVACSDIEIVEHYPDTEIDFSISTGKVVRATYDNTNFNQFYVWSIYNNDGATQYIMDGIPVNKSGESWSYGGKKYWPVEGVVDFVGIYPSTGVAQTVKDPRTNTPAASVNYTVSDAKREIRVAALRGSNVTGYPSNLPDVIYAVAEDKTKDSEAGKVAMNFRHAMAQAKFEIKNENPMWTIRFRPDSAIVLCNIRQSGTYALPTVTTSTGVETSGSWDEWNHSTNPPQDFTIFTATEAYVEGMTAANANGYIRPDVFMKNGEFSNLFPCANAKWDHTSGVAATAASQTGSYFVVWCRVEVNTPSMNDGTAPFVIWGDVNAKPTDKGYYLPIYAPVEINWKEGICYKYTFAFGRGLAYNEDGSANIVALTFSTEASSFTDAGSQDVTVQ